MLKRSGFPLSFNNQLTCNMGKLIPILCMETLPGDTFKVNTNPLIRFAPMVAPVMTDIDAQFWYFYVPNRILWDQTKQDCWETFITGGPTADAVPEHPHFIFSKTEIGGLSDYLNIVSTSTVMSGTDPSWPNDGIWVDALPYRAYDMIWNHWFRDENLQAEVPISLSGGKDMLTSTKLLSRNWEKDYFTSAFTSPQRGTGVSINLTGNAPVTGTAAGNVVVSGSTDGQILVTGNGRSIVYDDGKNRNYLENRYTVGSIDRLSISPINLDPNANPVPLGTSTQDIATSQYAEHSIGFSPEAAHAFGKTVGNLNVSASGNQQLSVTGTADMSGVSSVDITALRQASAIQRWLEKSMLFGSRYIEVLKSFFGVTPRDSRVSIPEYLGGFRTPILVSEVLQTSQTSSGSPQGNMAGHGFGARLGRKIKCFSPEHGWLIGLMCVTPRTSYFQGLPRQYSRKTRNDYFWPQFQGIGEQAILNKELYVTGTAANDDAVFGYQQRYAEYKTKSNEIHGDFRKSLNVWNLARNFENAPALNGTFVTSDPSRRIFANISSDVDTLWCKIDFVVKSYRRMSRYSKPVLK